MQWFFLPLNEILNGELKMVELEAVLYCPNTAEPGLYPIMML
jgi:hypothetical protein